MSKDLIGKRFGKLTIIERAGLDRTGKNSTWLCLCDCGNKKIISRCNLVQHHTLSCGCINSIPEKDDIKEQKRRFMKHVNIVSDKVWIWTGSKNHAGYGSFCYKGKTCKAHRVAYELFIGKIPKGLVCCHKFDDPSNVCPASLWIGTRQENSSDRDNKGRSAKGEKINQSKLTEQEVLEIRYLYKTANYSQRELGDMFNVTYGSIGPIINRKTWSHI
jgi:hypothetical protein